MCALFTTFSFTGIDGDVMITTGATGIAASLAMAHNPEEYFEGHKVTLKAGDR